MFSTSLVNSNHNDNNSLIKMFDIQKPDLNTFMHVPSKMINKTFLSNYIHKL